MNRGKLRLLQLIQERGTWIGERELHELAPYSSARCGVSLSNTATVLSELYYSGKIERWTAQIGNHLDAMRYPMFETRYAPAGTTIPRENW